MRTRSLSRSHTKAMPLGQDGGDKEMKTKTTTEINDFDEARITAAAENVRKKLSAMFDIEKPGRVDLFIGETNPNGLTMAEAEVAIIRALGLAVLDGTQRMFRFKSEVEDYDTEAA